MSRSRKKKSAKRTHVQSVYGLLQKIISCRTKKHPKEIFFKTRQREGAGRRGFDLASCCLRFSLSISRPV